VEEIRSVSKHHSVFLLSPVRELVNSLSEAGLTSKEHVVAHDIMIGVGKYVQSELVFILGCVALVILGNEFLEGNFNFIVDSQKILMFREAVEV